MIGAYITTKYGYYNACKAIKEIGGNTVQIELNNSHFIESKTKEDDIKKCRKFVLDNNIFLVNHSEHKINFGRNPDENHNAIKNYADDIIMIDKLGGYGSIVHMGKKLQLSEEDAIDNMVKSLHRVYELIKTSKAYILLENSAGEGTALYTIETMMKVYKNLHPDVQQKVKFVIDTCHSFTAGYNITTKVKSRDFYNKINLLLGWDNVACIHLNDSYEPLGSRKDRHQNLLLGHIGSNGRNIKGLIEFIKICYNTNKPMILETNPCLHAAEIQLVKNIISSNS